jgi:hypothetical protein
MANVNPTSPLQDLGAGDEQALALTQFAGTVLTAFDEMLVAGRYGVKHYLQSGDSWQFPATWKMSAESHTPGVELAGSDEPLTEERTVSIDDKELVGHAYLSKRDSLISHLDLIPEWAKQAARALAKQYDSYWLRSLILGARQSARGPASEFPAGNVVTRDAATLVAAYPISLAGSKNLQDDLGEIAQDMDEKDVPKENRVAFLSPYLKRVIRQDKTLLSRDYQDANDQNSRRLIEVEGFLVEETNNMPSSNIATGESTYQGNFSLTACCCIGDSSAVGTVFLEDIEPFGPEWYTNRRAWLLGAAMFQGSKWLRPEACGEIAIDGT